ncbi:hypothetical protein MKEN_01261500 [Mycena kentingensis (nom. inval.)]|nr:hypothetical protein MKEN_01261500 [Mycena kentingensis (nom. inval.)]
MIPNSMQQEAEALEKDPIWTSSRTARQIYALGQVEKDISRLLALAASSISLLTLPQTDAPDENLPKDEERSEQFVLEVNEYFDRLNSVQGAIRSSLAQITYSRIAPSAINAPPPTLCRLRLIRGLQEERVARDAWMGILDALKRLKAEQEAEAAEKVTAMDTQ